MGSNITSVAGILSAGQAGSVIGSKEDDLQLQFAQVMSQMTSQVGTGIGSNTQNAYGDKSTKTSEAVKTENYEQFQYRESNIKKQSERMDPAKVSESNEKLESYANDVKEVLKEELGVTEEEIETVMEQLGMTVVDLMDMKQLAGLIMELTGCEDMGQLLCGEEFLTVLHEVGALTENMLTELGVTAEELQQMCQNQMELTDTTASADTAVVENPVGAEETADTTQDVSVPDEEAADRTDSAEMQAKNVSDAQNGQNAKAEIVLEKEADAREAEHTAVQTEDDEIEMVKSETVTEETEEVQFAQTTENETESKGQQSQGSLEQHGNHAAGQQTAVVSDNAQAVNVQTAETVPEFTRQLDTEHIIRQIVEFTKVHVSSAESSMEMQLNPENLGKIYIEVTAKQGNVSAHITAQNEFVKEALEAQLVELKQNMNQAGVKVDAVEVTVGSHEFEQNLEQNAKQEEEQAKEQEKSLRKMRRLNLSDLDELSGVMSEEETLVAQIMADHGNSIDYTA